MEVTVTIPDDLVPMLQEALAGTVSAEFLADRFRQQWEAEVDQRVTNWLTQQAQIEAAATVAAARQAAAEEAAPAEEVAAEVVAEPQPKE